MFKKNKLKKAMPLPLGQPMQNLPTGRPCNCVRSFNRSDDLTGVENNDAYILIENVWTPDRCISNHHELMALVDEPIFITGRNDWQEKELRTNTRELGMCHHFMKRLTVEYLCYFVQELLRKKQDYLDRHAINYSVTFYMWDYYGSDVGGRAFLCYDFISGHNPKLPFGAGVKEKLHIKTFMRKFLAFKVKKSNSHRLHLVTKILNVGMVHNETVHCSDEILADRYKEYKENVKLRMLPKDFV